jgi:pyroglutamyl-peptidase
MPFTILLTGFGPFPGAPFNPTGALVHALARKRHGVFAGVRRFAHVFPTSYDAIDRELPALMARLAPDLIVMFGLAQRTKHLRIESCARNAVSCAHPDAAGLLPTRATIVPGAPATLPLRAPILRLLAAARATGMPAALSHNAGGYLCNYLCWRVSEHANAPDGPALVSFVHVPSVLRSPCARLHGLNSRRRPFTLDHLVQAGEAIVLAALGAARVRR